MYETTEYAFFFSRWLDEYFTFCIHFTLNFQSIDGATNLLTNCQITLIGFLQMSSNPSLRSPQTQAESSQTKRSFVVEFPRFPSRNGVDLSQLRPCRMNAELLRLSWSFVCARFGSNSGLNLMWHESWMCHHVSCILQLISKPHSHKMYERASNNYSFCPSTTRPDLPFAQ